MPCDPPLAGILAKRLAGEDRGEREPERPYTVGEIGPGSRACARPGRHQLV